MKEMGVKIRSQKCAWEGEKESGGRPRSCLTMYCK